MHPECNYDFQINSYFEGGERLNQSIVNFTDNSTLQLLTWEVNATEKMYTNVTKKIIVEFKIDNGLQTFVDTSSFTWDLIFKWIRWPLDHNPPFFSKAEDLPSRLKINIGEKKTIDTGIPSIDTVQTDFKVVSDKDIWSKFIFVRKDSETMRIVVDIQPTITEMIGQYILTFELTDTGCDSKVCPTDDYLCIPMTTLYKVSLIVSKDQEFIIEKIEGDQELDYPEAQPNCDLSFGNKKCNPHMELKEINYYGLVKFEFNHDMVVPGDYQHWTGVNSKLQDEPGKGPLNLMVVPGEEQDTGKLNLKWSVDQFSSR